MWVQLSGHHHQAERLGSTRGPHTPRHWSVTLGTRVPEPWEPVAWWLGPQPWN